MVDREGNVLKVPGTGAVAEVKGDEILGSYARFTQKGLTLLKDNGVIEAGTVLKVSGTAKKYMPAAKADVANAIGIIRKGVDTTGADKLANFVVSGIIKGSKIKYSDDTNGLTTGELQALASALGGHYDPVMDYVII